jgi:two-component system sensor histidine kinase SenX3
MRRRDAEAAVATASAAVAAAEARADDLAAALDALALGVVVADETGAVLFRNRRAAELADGRHGDALVAHALTALLARGPGAEVVELQGPPRRTLELSVESVGTRRVGVVEDVTERRHLEAVRRDFVANVSHELRTPIGALSVLAETLADEEDAAVVRRLVGRISSESERAGRIIEDLLDLSRIEAEGARARRPIALGAVLESALARVGGAAEERGIDVRATVGDVTVLGDEAQLVSAVANLIDNAVKYSEPGSPVDVEVAASGDDALVRVRDRGIGIPAADVERVFERFYRVDRARSRATGGTGLGLSIVRHVVENHGGSVEVASREGEGSAFTIRLPRQGA